MIITLNAAQQKNIDRLLKLTHQTTPASCDCIQRDRFTGTLHLHITTEHYMLDVRLRPDGSMLTGDGCPLMRADGRLDRCCPPHRMLLIKI
jgi:hypothetical protein